jgi:hypothetical protein
MLFASVRDPVGGQISLGHITMICDTGEGGTQWPRAEISVG